MGCSQSRSIVPLTILKSRLFFLPRNTRTGNELAWDTAESRGVMHEEEEGEDHDHDYYAPAKTTKFSKVTGGIDISSNSKIQKAGKVGKMMWDEEPIMLKGDKKMKGLKSKSLKSLKSSKKYKSGKSDYEGRGGYYDSVDEDESHDDIIGGLFSGFTNTNDDEEEGGGGDWQSLFQSSGTGYGDIFSSAGAEDAVLRSDDYFDPMLTERADFEGDSETQGRKFCFSLMLNQMQNTFPSFVLTIFVPNSFSLQVMLTLSMMTTLKRTSDWSSSPARLSLLPAAFSRSTLKLCCPPSFPMDRATPSLLVPNICSTKS